MDFKDWEYAEIMAYLFSKEEQKQEVIELVKKRLKENKDENN